MRLRILNGPSEGKVFVLSPGSNLIGRWDSEGGAFPEIDLEQEDLDAKISRKHAVIAVQGQNVTIEDIGSLNGTFLNRVTKLSPGKRVLLAPGDEINIGALLFRFELDSEGP